MDTAANQVRQALTTQSMTDSQWSSSKEQMEELKGVRDGGRYVGVRALLSIALNQNNLKWQPR